jgi:hypothetical protein
MPGGDRTGPMGGGPRTGRGAGYCAGSAVPGFMQSSFGGGFGRGRGGGWGRRHRFHATGWPGWARAGWNVATSAGAVGTPTREQELDALKQQADQTANMLEQIRRRISELEGSVQPCRS